MAPTDGERGGEPHVPDRSGAKRDLAAEGEAGNAGSPAGRRHGRRGLAASRRVIEPAFPGDAEPSPDEGIVKINHEEWGIQPFGE